MVDTAIYNKGVDFYSRIAQSVDDVLVALLKALQNKADKEAEKVIQDLLLYVENGGKLNSIEINNDALQVLTNRMKDKELSFFSTSDSEDDTMTIVHFKDKDAGTVSGILKDLSIEGVKLQNTNRVDLQEFIRNKQDAMAQAVYTLDEYKNYHKDIHRILNRDLNIPYSSHRSVDQKYVVVTVDAKYTDELSNYPAFKNRINRLDKKLTLNEVKQNLEKMKMESGREERGKRKETENTR